MSDAPELVHGVVGNGNVLALVHPSTAVEWLCMPRFDSPSVFARLLDRERGGTFRFRFDGEQRAGESRYLRNTNVLATRFEDGGRAWECVDFAPRTRNGWGVHAPLRFCRLLRPLRGTVRVRVEFDPRMDYARGRTTLTPLGRGLRVSSEAGSLTLRSNAPIAYLLGGSEFVLHEPLFFDLQWGEQSQALELPKLLSELEETVEGWRLWAKTCALPLFEPELVLRSALCLKLHASEDTGAILAAATTSIPEALGTERTWDYRYCWLRDAAFTVEALRRLSHLREGERFLGFLRDVAEAGPLQPVYALDGRRELPEELLPHLEGFGGARPVRIGNAAAVQSQHDVLGELVLCLETLLSDPRLVPRNTRDYVALLRRLVEESLLRAEQPDTSIWEFRTLPRHYTFSRAMCWTAAHRGARLALHLGEGALARRWESAAEKSRAVVLEQGYNASLGYFTQALSGEEPDAANLLLPTLGLLDARDPRFVSTLEATERLLLRDGLLLRYRNLDDFGETTSAFTVCSFWWAEALALAGQLEKAVEVFHRVCAYANPLGLFSEDIDPRTGRLLGNFPQAYTHVGLIHAALTISELLDARDGRVRAWTRSGLPPRWRAR